MNAHLAATRDVLDELYASLLDLLRGSDDACLNWRPDTPATNSIAALVHHIAGSTETWLARALAEPIQRDRDAEFRAAGPLPEIVALVERSRARVCEQLDRLDAVDPGTVRRVRRLDRADAQPLTVAWCVAHAVIHAGERWGQIQLNRQLYAAQDDGEVPGTDIYGDETTVRIREGVTVPGIASTIQAPERPQGTPRGEHR